MKINMAGSVCDVVLVAQPTPHYSETFPDSQSTVQLVFFSAYHEGNNKNSLSERDFTGVRLIGVIIRIRSVESIHS
jgi:hypothetical protein